MNGEEFFAHLRCEVPMNTKGEYKMANQFIHTVTTRTVKAEIDAYGPDSVNMTVVQGYKGVIQLVIGARFDKRESCYISTRGLRDLAKQLNEIADVMDEEVCGF